MKRLTTLLQSLRLVRRVVGTPAGLRLSVVELFDASLEATLIVDAAHGTVLEANSAAAELFGRSRERLTNLPWLGLFSGASAICLSKLDAITRSVGRADPIRAEVRDSQREVDVSLSLVRAASIEYLLCHLTVANGGPVMAPLSDPGLVSMAMLGRVADGFAVADPGLRILYANRAFAELAGLKSATEATGKSLTRWLAFSQDDLTALGTQMQAREAVTSMHTSFQPLNPKLAPHAVDVTVVAVPDDPQRCFGFWITVPGREAPCGGRAS